jgi:hypothetical protein
VTGQTEELHSMNAVYPSDLEINRDNRLSEAQKRSLRLSINLWYGLAILDIGIFLLLTYLQLHFRIEASGFVFLCIFSIFAAGYCIAHTTPLHKDIKADEVKSIAGKVFKRAVLTGSKHFIGQCTIQVGRQVFTISPKLYDSMANEDFYRVYFAPNTKRVVNIEEI